jgi:hypothetical protein
MHLVMLLLVVDDDEADDDDKQKGALLGWSSNREMQGDGVGCWDYEGNTTIPLRLIGAVLSVSQHIEEGRCWPF